MAENIYSVTEVAETLGVERHRVTYAIKSRHIEPDYVLGKVRAYSEETLKTIATAVRAAWTEQRRREPVRAFMAPDQERQHDHPSTPPELVAEIVYHASARAAEERRRLVKNEGLTEDEAHKKLCAEWRAKCAAEEAKAEEDNPGSTGIQKEDNNAGNGE